MLRHKEASDNRGGRLQLGARGAGPGRRRVRFLRLQEVPPSTPPEMEEVDECGWSQVQSVGEKNTWTFFYEVFENNIYQLCTTVHACMEVRGQRVFLT